MSDESKAIEVQDVALGDSINAITRHIGIVVIKNVKDEMVDPFQLAANQQIAEIREEVSNAESRFTSSVVDIVKSAKRDIVQDRLDQFDIPTLIQKITEIPESIANQQTNTRLAESTLKRAQESYDSELINVSTSAGQQGMIGQNKEDRDAILILIKDRIKNPDKYTTRIDLVFQSSGRDKVIMECKELDIERARTCYESMAGAERNLEMAKVDLEKLRNQFSSLRSVSSLIVSVVS